MDDVGGGVGSIIGDPAFPKENRRILEVGNSHQVFLVSMWHDHSIVGQWITVDHAQRLGWKIYKE